MEKNTVILDLFLYNTLRDFKENMEKGKTFFVNGYNIPSNWGVSCEPVQTYVTSDEAVQQIAEVNKNLKTQINSLQTEIYNLKYPQQKETTVEDIKKMSVMEFIKWRKK